MMARKRTKGHEKKDRRNFLAAYEYVGLRRKWQMADGKKVGGLKDFWIIGLMDQSKRGQASVKHGALGGRGRGRADGGFHNSHWRFQSWNRARVQYGCEAGINSAKKPLTVKEFFAYKRNQFTE